MGEHLGGENKPASSHPSPATGQPLADDSPHLTAHQAALYDVAAVWVFIAAFVGMAVAWSSGWAPAWLGALTGGTIAFFLGAWLISRLSPIDPDRSEQAAPKSSP